MDPKIEALLKRAEASAPAYQANEAIAAQRGRMGQRSYEVFLPDGLSWGELRARVIPPFVRFLESQMIRVDALKPSSEQAPAEGSPQARLFVSVFADATLYFLSWRSFLDGFAALEGVALNELPRRIPGWEHPELMPGLPAPD